MADQPLGQALLGAKNLHIAGSLQHNNWGGRQEVQLNIDAIESYSKELDLTAMEKWTGWHIAIMALEIAYNRVNKGAISVENALKGHVFLEEAKKRNYNIDIDIKEC